MRSVLLAAVLGLCLLSPSPGRASDDAEAATDFVRQVGREMPTILGHATTIEEKRARLQPFIARVVDVGAVARFCLGRYWDRATAQQQQSYQALFLSVLVNTIATWAGDYKGGGSETHVVMERPIIAADATSVPTTIQTAGAPAAHVTWVVNMQTRPPKILDVVAAGFSLRTTQRSDYVSYLGHHNGDVDGLISILRKRAVDVNGDPFTAAPLLRPPAR